VAAVDSNVLLRLLVQDDDVQERAAGAFFRTAGRVFVAQIVLVELVWALRYTYEFPKARVIAVLERLLDLETLVLQDATTVAQALEDYRSSSADFSDCLILALARKENELPLATFDAKLAKLSGVRKLGGRPAR
jgi:predicted nucleic-acid-binding protein